LRELQPTADKLSLAASNNNFLRLGESIETMAKITAAAHLHSSDQLGAASSHDLISFGYNLDWQQQILIYAQNYADQVRVDYDDFCRAIE
jgi:Uncharacterized protein conserved in bacteria (DUF2252)